MATDQIYPVVLARDAAATVEFTLESLRDFPEVIVYAWGSKGRTRETCRNYPNAHFVGGDFLGKSVSHSGINSCLAFSSSSSFGTL